VGGVEAGRAPQLAPALGEEVTDEAEVSGEVRRVELGHVPPGQVGVDPVVERCVVAHLLRHGPEQVAAAQLVGDVHVEVADHHDPTVGADALLATAELARLHVALEDVDAFLGVERDAGDLVEADDVVLGDEAPSPRRVVHEHVGDGRLAARDEVGVRRHLLEQVRLAGATGPELDGVVVGHHERDHAGDQHVLLPAGKPGRLEPDAAQQQVTPLVQSEMGTSANEGLQRIAGRHLDGPHRLHPERLPARLPGERGDVLEGDLGVEPAGEHSVVLVHEIGGDVDVIELEARKFSLVGVGLGVEPGPEQVDDFDLALLPGPRLEQLLVAGADCPLLHRPLDDGQAFCDLV
jgi:hypothetical protein